MSNVGRYCRVKLSKTLDFFRKEERNNVDIIGESWDIGRIKRASRRQFTVLFDDGVEETYRQDEVELLSRHKAHKHLLVSEGQSGMEFAVNERPQSLSPGDEVYCFYQKGLKGNWYPGRVKRADERTCDICYDDGELEMGIPYKDPKHCFVKLIESVDRFSWLDGLGVSTERDQTEVDTVSYKSGSLYLTSPKGKSTPMTYQEVVEPLMANASVSGNSKILQWPEASFKGLSYDETIAAEATRGTAPSSTRQTRARLDEQKENIDFMTSDNDDYDDDYDEDKTEKPSSRCRTKLRSACLTKRQRHTHQPVPRIKAIRPSYCSSDAALPSEVTGDYSPMESKFEGDCLDVLDGIDPFRGSQNLDFFIKILNKMPGNDFLEHILNRLTKGPTTGSGDNELQYPDCYRMMIISDVFDNLLQAGFAGKIANVAPENWVETVFLQMKEPYYEVSNNEEVYPSLRRHGLSVHAKSCCMVSFQRLLEQQILKAKQQNGELRPSLAESPIAYRISQNSRLCLLNAIVAWVEIYGQEAQFLSIDRNEMAKSNLDMLDMVTKHSLSLREALSRSVSLLAVIFCSTGHKASDVAGMMRSAISDSEIFAQMEEKQQRRVKLEMVIALGGSNINELPPCTAEQLGVADLFNLIYRPLDTLASESK